MCSIGFKLVQNLFKCVQMCSNMFKLAQNLFKCYQRCSNVFKLVQNLFKCGQMFSNVFKLVPPGTLQAYPLTSWNPDQLADLSSPFWSCFVSSQTYILYVRNHFSWLKKMFGIFHRGKNALELLNVRKNTIRDDFYDGHC